MGAAAVTVDVRAIRRLATVLNGVSLDAGERLQLLTDLGAELEDQTRERFETKRDPDGNPWKALSERYRDYLESRFPGAEPPLVVSGELRDTVESQPSDRAVLVGATKIYAAVHQFGWPERNIASRPYLGVGESDEAALAEIAEDFLARHFKAAG